MEHGFDLGPHAELRRNGLATGVYIDRTKTSVNGDPTQAWFGRNSRPSVELPGLQD